MSISTQRGDGGQTHLIGNIQVSKTHLCVIACGALDELISGLGVARSLCEEDEMNELVKSIQGDLFLINSSLATLPESQRTPPDITTEMVDRLTAEVRRVEDIEGILFNWSLPGEHRVSAAFDMARTICRRAECHIVALIEAKFEIDSNILPYINRLSDLLWLLGRWIELQAGIDNGF